MSLQFPQLPHPPTPLPAIGAADLELIHLTNFLLIWHMLKVCFSAVWACLPPLLCAKPVGEAGGTEVLATADSEVSIAKDLGTYWAQVPARQTVHKIIIIATSWLVPAR